MQLLAGARDVVTGRLCMYGESDVYLYTVQFSSSILLVVLYDYRYKYSYRFICKENFLYTAGLLARLRERGNPGRDTHVDKELIFSEFFSTV